MYNILFVVILFKTTNKTYRMFTLIFVTTHITFYIFNSVVSDLRN